MPLTDDLTEENFQERFDQFLDGYIRRELQKVRLSSSVFNPFLASLQEKKRPPLSLLELFS